MTTRLHHQILFKEKSNGLVTLYVFPIGTKKNLIKEVIEGSLNDYTHEQKCISEVLLQEQHKNIRDKSGVVASGGKNPYRLINNLLPKEFNAILEGKKIKRD
ncbi:MAG: hypothetical protein MRY57_01445 [Candidatus Pacebacteria bacterium]|nr:hypothetical protein [Candidatus Paceibacterota bacterium]